MTVEINGTTGVSSADLNWVAPLALSNGGTGTSTFVPYQMVLGTAQPTTSGTSIDFTGIPSWVKRITFMFDSVSTNGSSLYLIRMGASSGIETTNYQSADNSSGNTTGFVFNNTAAGYTYQGSYIFSHMGGNLWVGSGVYADGGTGGSTTRALAGRKLLSGVLDRIRLTTVNGTDTFDGGSVNIMYEG